jgi:hypothetical protein
MEIWGSIQGYLNYKGKGRGAYIFPAIRGGNI